MALGRENKRDRKLTLPITGSSFVVPRNVFIIGAMNTADRSISLMDTALRRRFGFVELMPDSTLLAGRKAGGLLLGAWLDALNTRLRRHLKRDARNLQIGHAYLMPPQPITSVAEFGRVLRDDIMVQSGNPGAFRMSTLHIRPLPRHRLQGGGQILRPGVLWSSYPQLFGNSPK
jgi:5-methylcytosine-specific restriction enzyme B